MNHPTTVWYLAQARLDDLNRALAQPHLPRVSHRGLRARLAARVPHRKAAAQVAPAGCALPMGCAA